MKVPKNSQEDSEKKNFDMGLALSDITCNIMLP